MAKKKSKYFLSSSSGQASKTIGALLVLIILAISSVALVGALNHWLHPTTPQVDQEALDRQAFIDRLVPPAQEAYQTYGVLPSISLAQAILESNWGLSLLSAQYNNLYGIKAGPDQASVGLETQEYLDGQWVTIIGDFRVFASWEESVEAHALLFVNGVNWNPQLYHPVLAANDYQQAAYALQEAGYATDPGYAQKLIALIKEYHLNQYDTYPEEVSQSE